MRSCTLIAWREENGAMNGAFYATLLSVFFSLAAGAVDTLAAGQSINQTEALVSADGRFRLGFFYPGKSRRRYLGIWYNRMAPRTVVWVANRGRPLPETSFGVLTMADNGSLVLIDTRGTSYWSTAPLGELRGPTAARLLDSGNLVVDAAYGGHVWQSFDHPGDTMLTGMKIGYDVLTGLSRVFTSWRTGEDPSPGNYTLAFDSRGAPQVLVLSGTAPLWRAGPWVGRHFTGIPEMNEYNNFSYSYVANPDRGIYFRFDVWDSSMLTRVVVTPRGTMEHLLWTNATGRWDRIWYAPKDLCDGYNRCGPNAVCNDTGPAVCSCLPGFAPRWPLEWERGVTVGGCMRKVSLECRRGRGSFSIVTRAKLPDTSAAAVAMGVGLEECRAACLRNCFCTAFTSSDGSGCITWSDDLVDIRVFRPPDTAGYPIGAGQDLYVRQQQGSTRTKKEVMVVTTVSITVLLLLLLMGASRRQLLAMLAVRENAHYNRKDVDLPVVHFNAISSATKGFSHENRIGEGGFGTVYKGKLDGEDIAVKRLSKHSIQGLEEFKSEIQLVAKLQHMNLVKLLGYCAESEEKILIYEYMPNQSLDKFIFDPERGRQLDWRKRSQIINGIAQGLLYLHQYSRLKVIHRDLKASNILLDAEWNPKISDFGLAKISTWNNSQENTSRIVGTHGYMSPEYVIRGRFSVKSDVFSFGVLLLEICSGKKNSSSQQFAHSLDLLGYAWDLWRGGRELELVDPTLDNAGPDSEMSRVIRVGLLCVQEGPEDRPTMADVVSMLNNGIMGLRDPKQPAFFIGRNMTGGHLQALFSSNDVTMTRLVGR